MRQISLLNLALIAMVASMSLAGCHRGPSATSVYGRASNPDREARGLPIIPPTWIEDAPGGYESHWKNPAPRIPGNPIHAGKDVFIDKTGRPVKEIDYYFSGKQYPSKHVDPDDPGPQREKLSVAYDFDAALAGKNPWYCEVNCGPHERMPDGEVTFEEAEAILKEWGIKRK